MSTSIYEQIMVALLAVIKTNCGSTFVTYSRRLKTWEQMIQDLQNGQPTVKQPALYLYDGVGLGGGRVKYEPRGRGSPGVRILERSIVIYAMFPGGGTPRGIDSTTAGGTIFAPLVDAIELAFSPEVGDGPGGTLTLGGLVSHCWIEGESIWITPDIDQNGQGMLTFPVRIMIP